MLETIILSTNGESFTLVNALLVIISSIILGLIISLVYMRTNKKIGYSTGFSIALIMLPAIISIIILLVGNNVARAFSLVGTFSIISFRSEPKNPKDIAYVFFTLAVGLTCGMGYITYGFMFTIILCTLMILLDITKFAMPKNKTMKLKITIPEDLNYEGVFEDILSKYTNSWSIDVVKTRDFGALFELYYTIHMKPESDQKKFIDELRCRNGNLNITLNLSGFDEKVYA